MKLTSDGCAIARGILGAAQIEHLRDALAGVQPERAGVRNIAGRIAAAGELAASRFARDLVEPVLGTNAFLVRSIFFDKTREANWAVLWHQDLTIAVQSRAEVAGFGPWSEKDGTPHVQPPGSVLETMLTLRFHLDDADETNGALLVMHFEYAAAPLPPPLRWAVEG